MLPATALIERFSGAFMNNDLVGDSNLRSLRGGDLTSLVSKERESSNWVLTENAKGIDDETHQCTMLFIFDSTKNNNYNKCNFSYWQ